MKKTFKLFIYLFPILIFVSNINLQLLAQTTATIPNSDNQIDAILWVQKSAEYRACCYQAFNYAKLIVDGRDCKLKNPAVIFDLDETLINNSKAQAQTVKDRSDFDATEWTKWCNALKTEAIPGAADFITYLIANKIEPIYISNRLEESERNATIQNMKNLGFKDIKPENILLKTNTSSKTERRDKIFEKYDVILLVGDNLADFNDVFEGRSFDQRKTIYNKDGIVNKIEEEKWDKKREVDALKNEFGKKFIILPNPMYGDWAKLIPGTKEEKIKTLEGWK